VNLLYLNNVITDSSPGAAGQSCYAVSWYLANDVQVRPSCLTSAGPWASDLCRPRAVCRSSSCWRPSSRC
jgi:hypothetical protein